MLVMEERDGRGAGGIRHDVCELMTMVIRRSELRVGDDGRLVEVGGGCLRLVEAEVAVEG